METFSALLAICVGNSPVTGEFPSQRPVTRSFDVFFHLRLNERLSNNREVDDLIRHRTHYDVTVMNTHFSTNFLLHMHESAANLNRSHTFYLPNHFGYPALGNFAYQRRNISKMCCKIIKTSILLTKT